MIQKMQAEQIIEKWKQTRTPDIHLEVQSFKPESIWEQQNIPAFFRNIFSADDPFEEEILHSYLTDDTILKKWHGVIWGTLSGDVQNSEQERVLNIVASLFNNLSTEIKKARANRDGKVFWTVELRKASETDGFPYGAKTVPFLKIDPKLMMVTQANTPNEKRKMLQAATDEDLLLAAWPGQWSQDVFEIDNRDLALKKL